MSLPHQEVADLLPLTLEEIAGRFGVHPMTISNRLAEHFAARRAVAEAERLRRLAALGLTTVTTLQLPVDNGGELS